MSCSFFAYKQDFGGKTCVFPFLPAKHQNQTVPSQNTVPWHVKSSQFCNSEAIILSWILLLSGSVSEEKDITFTDTLPESPSGNAFTTKIKNETVKQTRDEFAFEEKER